MLEKTAKGFSQGKKYIKMIGMVINNRASFLSW